MKTIWKYELNSKHEAIPKGSKLLDVQMQNRSICAWFLVDPAKKMVERDIRIYMTGEDLPDDIGKHVATVQLDEFVFHIFDYGETEKKL